MRERGWIPTAGLLGVALMVGLSPGGALAQGEDREGAGLRARLKGLEERVRQLERLVRDQALALEELRLRLIAADAAPMPGGLPSPKLGGVAEPERARALVRRAEGLIESRRLKEALSLLELALTCDPQSAEVHLTRGALLGRLGRGGEAKVSLTRAYELAPGPRTLLARATLLRALGELEASCADLERAQRLAAGAREALPAEVHELRASVLAQLGRWEEAEASALSFLAVAEPCDGRRRGVGELLARVRLERSEAFFERGEHEAARRLLRLARTSDPEQLARASLLAGRLAMSARPVEAKAAVKAFSRALETAEGALRAQLCFERGMAYYEQHQLDEAAADLRAALAEELPRGSGVSAAEAHYVLARCHLLRAEWAGVVEHMERFLALAARGHRGRAAAARALERARGELREARRHGPYQQRYDRDQALLAGGGSDETEAAVDAALAWLARAQSKDGRWDGDAWAGLERHPREGRNGADSRFDVGLTALALLVYTGRGQTHLEGRYRGTCAKALRWLLAQQTKAGTLGFRRGEEIYNHAIATAALGELYGLSGDRSLRPPLERALRWCLAAQNPGLGWQYGVRTGRNDTSVTTWMVFALDAARTAGLEVPEEAFAGALCWLKRATSSRGEAGYMTPGGGSSFMRSNDGKFDPLPVMTGSALFARALAGEEPGARQRVQGAKLLGEARPEWSPRTANFYHWHFGTYALFQQGGPEWKAWNAKLRRALLGSQVTRGAAKGSWPPIGEWCLAGGRVYATAINALSLQVYYRLNRR